MMYIRVSEFTLFKEVLINDIFSFCRVFILSHIAMRLEFNSFNVKQSILKLLQSMCRFTDGFKTRGEVKFIPNCLYIILI